MGVISFARGIPGPDLLPAEAFGACAKAAAEKDGARALNYGPPSGYPPLRDWVAARHDVDPARVVLTTGSLQGFNFVAHTFAAQDATIFVEAPCYDRSLGILRSVGAQAVSIPLREDGLDVDALAVAVEATAGPKLIYTIPTFQNPSGRTLAAENRARLLELRGRNRLHDPRGRPVRPAPLRGRDDPDALRERRRGRRHLPQLVLEDDRARNPRRLRDPPGGARRRDRAAGARELRVAVNLRAGRAGRVREPGDLRAEPRAHAGRPAHPPGRHARRARPRRARGSALEPARGRLLPLARPSGRRRRGESSSAVRPRRRCRS